MGKLVSVAGNQDKLSRRSFSPKGFESFPMAPKSENRKVGAGTIRIGPPGWSYTDWGKIDYPAPNPRGFHEAAYLAEFFETIEINTSFYHPLRAEHSI